MSGRSIGTLSKWARNVIFGYDGAEAQAAHVDSDGALRIKGQIDAGVDIEISGSAVSVVQYTATATGDNTVLSVAGGVVLQLRKVTVNADADVTGNVLLKVGSSNINELQGPIKGGNHTLFNAGESFVEGGGGDDLIVNLPASVVAEVTAHYTTRAV